MSAVVVNAVGDVWFGDHPVRIGHGVRSLRERKRKGFIFECVRHEFAGGDINLCNLECVLSDAGLQKGRISSMEMRGSPDAVEDLAFCGFNYVSVANNHILQHGIDAFHETISVLHSQEIKPIGIDVDARSKVEFYSKGNIHVALVAFSIHPESYYQGVPLYSYRDTFDSLLGEIRELRNTFKGFIVLSLHWGHEFLDYPSPEQRERAALLCDAGVDVLLGSHSHVWQGVERMGRSLVFYSLGNFVFDLWQEECRFSAIARVSLSDDGGIDYQLVPFRIGKFYQPYIPVKNERKQIEIAIENVNRRLFFSLDQGSYLRFAKMAENSFRFSSYRYFIKNLFRYRFSMIMQSIGRMLIRRMGLH